MREFFFGMRFLLVVVTDIQTENDKMKCLLMFCVSSNTTQQEACEADDEISYSLVARHLECAYNGAHVELI